MDFEAEKPNSVIEGREEMRARIAEELEKFGVRECPEEIVNRFILIEENSKFNHDSRMILEGFENVIEAITQKEGGKVALSEKQKKEGAVSAYLHDIGKTSSSSEERCQLAVIKLFSVEEIKDPNQMVSEVVKEFFSGDESEMLSALAEVGIDGQMTMRAFWDRHAFWTKDVLDRHPDSFSERVRLIAASHHIDRGINPCGLDEEDVPDESKIIGSLEYYVDMLEERIIMAIDQYQAAMFRRKITHQLAMEYIRKSFDRYKNDRIMKLVIETIDELGSQGLLFPKTASFNLAGRR